MKLKNLLNIVFLLIMIVLALATVSCLQEPPSILIFTSTPSEIKSGDTSVLKWDVKGATDVTLDQGIGEVAASGSKALAPLKTTAYTITATSAGGTVTKAVVIYVTEPPPPSQPPPDTTPPVIKDVSTSSETDTGAVITWTTDKPASSNVDYGKNTGYGLTASSAALTNDHSITLSDLEPNTVYHFRVTSSDKAGNQASSDDNIFATVQEKSPYSMVLVSLDWGRRTDYASLGMEETPIAGKKWLYVKGTLQNKSQGSLRVVMITMNCWSGDKIVKYEVYVHRSSVLPGQIFSFNIETADDPAVDNVTVDFADPSGKEIVVDKQQ